MRYAVAALLVLSVGLHACSSEPSPEPQGEKIDCAIGAGSQFAPVCTYEFIAEEQQAVIHHPDGGFRRFTLLPGGAGVAGTDGAEEVIQGMMGGQLEVTVGEDRYRFPTIPAPR